MAYGQRPKPLFTFKGDKIIKSVVGLAYLSVVTGSSGGVEDDGVVVDCWSVGGVTGGEQIFMQLLYSAVFLSTHCLFSSSVNPPAGGQNMSFARLSFAQLPRQSDFSSAKPVPDAGLMTRSNRVMKNTRMLISLNL